MIKLKHLPLKAGEQQYFALGGTYIRILSATGTLRLQLEQGGESEIIAGIGFQPQRPFQGFWIESPTDQTVLVGVAEGIIDDNRLAGDIDLNGALEMITTAAETVNQGTTTVTETATEVVAANPNRRSLLFQVNAESEANVYYGTTGSVTTNTGIRVAPGGALTVENALPCYFITGAGLTADVVYLEEVN